MNASVLLFVKDIIISRFINTLGGISCHLTSDTDQKKIIYCQSFDAKNC